jgi:hypothetical protein
MCPRRRDGGSALLQICKAFLHHLDFKLEVRQIGLQFGGLFGFG